MKSDKWDIQLQKTGYIREAGKCLVMMATIASKPVVIVLLDSLGKYTRVADAQRVKHWLETGESAPDRDVMAEKRAAGGIKAARRERQAQASRAAARSRRDLAKTAQRPARAESSRASPNNARCCVPGVFVGAATQDARRCAGAAGDAARTAPSRAHASWP